MIPGDPYDTRQFDDLRSVQRRLRVVLRRSDAINGSAGVKPETLELAAASPVSELALRRVIAEIWETFAGWLRLEEHRQHVEEVRRLVLGIREDDTWVDAAITELLNAAIGDLLERAGAQGTAEPTANDIEELRGSLLLADMAETVASHSS